MAIAPKTKRSATRVVRATKRRRQLADRKAEKRSRAVSLATLFAAREAAIRRGDYDILGRLVMLRLEGSSMDFGLRNGPMIAQLRAGSAHAKDVAQPIVVLDGWAGLPVVVNLSPERCDACLATCHYCGGTGERACGGLRCGGYGKQILSYKACQCREKNGKAQRGCSDCDGSGQVIDQTAECPTCKGTKVQVCGGCNGSKQISTGLEGGASPSISDAKVCPKCEGSYHKLMRRSQPWQDYYRGDLEEFVVMAPIGMVLFYADQMRDPEGKLEMIEFSPDQNGNLGALLVRRPDTIDGQQPMYLLGGEALIRPM
jgi:hypothetical protein